MFSEKDLLFRVPEENILKNARGNFSKRVFVFICREPGYPDGLPFLEKVLGAAGLSLEKDTLLAEVLPTDAVSFLPAVKEKHAASILVFGIPPEQLGLGAGIPPYLPYPFYGTTFLFADKLSVLEPDKALKGKLWQALQQLYR